MNDIPVVLLVLGLSGAWAQPGPEQQAPSEIPAASVGGDPAAEAVPDHGDKLPSRASKPDSNVVDTSVAAAPIPEAGAIADDSVRASATSDSTGAANPGDSAAAAASMMRQRAEAMKHSRGRPGFGAGNVPPPVVYTPPAAAASAEDSTPYEDERGGGHRLKSDPKASKLYRSPRKAFFYSLVVPGAGQAWCGAYVRAGVFVAAEVGLFYGWYDISIRQARAKSREAKRYADANWSASRYEATRKRLYDEALENKSVVDQASPYRDRYCDAIYGYEESIGRSACLDRPADSVENYRNHIALLQDSGLSVQAVGDQRSANIKDLPVFYDRIGRDEEFVPGWADATSSTVTFTTLRTYDSAATDSDPATVPSPSPWGTSNMRAIYLGMRQDADDLASTQSWFLGGLVLNHLLSAVDAALTAQRSNRRLYSEEKTTWIDGLHVQGGLAWSNGPATRADMFLEF